VTGASTGLGEQLTTILYGANATVYLATRSAEKTYKAIEGIKAAHPRSSGKLVFLSLDLADLSTIKRSADEFLSLERRLDVLWLNAGVMIPPQGSKTAQGYELQLGTNTLGHFLFVKHLHSILKQTAATAPKNSVRIVWVSSSGAEAAPQPAIDMNNLDYHKDLSAWGKYFVSKAGNVFHSKEFARRTKGEGIINVSMNPGNLKTDLQRHAGAMRVVMNAILRPAIYGAYTELFAGLSDQIGEAQNGGWIVPWGRITKIRKDFEDKELARKFWEWYVLVTDHGFFALTLS
jgi:NAD(P)-dependent dehydrogenase (short-subunit alcohol dehydrogenase family)